MSERNGGGVPAGTFATIDDGYDEKGFIKAVEGLHPAIRFEMRRMTAEEQRRHQKTIRRLGDNDTEYFGVAAEMIAGHVTWWDVRHFDRHLKDASALPITKDAILRKLKPEVIAKLVSILSGMTPSDLDPEWESKEDADEMAVAAGEKSPAEIDSERQKN